MNPARLSLTRGSTRLPQKKVPPQMDPKLRVFVIALDRMVHEFILDGKPAPKTLMEALEMQSTMSEEDIQASAQRMKDVGVALVSAVTTLTSNVEGFLPTLRDSLNALWQIQVMGVPKELVIPAARAAMDAALIEAGVPTGKPN